MARRAPDFANDPIRGMVAVGAVGPRSARLWFRAPTPGTLVLRWWPEADPKAASELRVPTPDDPAVDGTGSVEIPGPGATPLEPRRCYAFRAVLEPEHGNVEPLGGGRFETSAADEADAPDRFAVGILSCHQPFNRRGRVGHHANAMLGQAIEVLERHEVKLVLAMGDPAYSDYPPRLSLFHPPHFDLVAPPGRRTPLCG